MVQTCSHIAHLEESVWGMEGHPASEFWAWRHVKYVDVAVDEGIDANTEGKTTTTMPTTTRQPPVYYERAAGLFLSLRYVFFSRPTSSLMPVPSASLGM